MEAAELDSKPRRYLLVDALRGVAAILVVFYHVYSKNIVSQVSSELPLPLHVLFTHGNLGVFVFFVLSGFVIANSVGDDDVRAPYVARFTLRRSIRLDVPYWATILLTLILLPTISTLMGTHPKVPSLSAVASNLFYLQGFLGEPHVLGVFWTLCLEIQFYICFVILVAVSQWISVKFFSNAHRQMIRRCVFASLLVVAVLTIAGFVEDIPGSFVRFWPYFYLGVLANWAFRKTTKTAELAFIAIGLGYVAFRDPTIAAPMTVAIVTAGSLFLARHRDMIYRWSLGRPLQFLGRISYSLYLTHMLVGSRIARLGASRLGDAPTALSMLLIIAIALAGSICAAYVFYRLVEVPSMRWSRRVVLSR